MVNGDKLTGFNLAGADGKIIPAEAVIEGKNVVVTSDEIATPISVRFAWATVPHVNLFNQEGLFAAPFSTKL
jgi:sialate O-acetylesterase